MAEDRAVRRDAVAELGQALRDLVDAAVRTEVPVERLAEATRAARELTGLLSAELRELHEIASVDDPASLDRMLSPLQLKMLPWPAGMLYNGKQAPKGIRVFMSSS